MEKKILNYRVIIEPDERTGTSKQCYTAYCPTLSIATDGDTIEEALKNIHEAILLRIDVLNEDNEIIPVDNIDQEIVVHTQVSAPKGIKIATL